MSKKSKTRTKKIIFVDTENVGQSWTSLITHLKEGDEIVLLSSSDSVKVSYSSLSQVQNCKGKITFEKTEAGTPNALDFQLVALLGIKATKTNESIIISKDKGYDAAIKKLNEKGYLVQRMNSIEATSYLKTGKSITEKEVKKEVEAETVTTTQPTPAKKKTKIKNPYHTSNMNSVTGAHGIVDKECKSLAAKKRKKIYHIICNHKYTDNLGSELEKQIGNKQKTLALLNKLNIKDEHYS